MQENSSASAIRQIREEIDRLTRTQSEALSDAVYKGMTAEEAQEYDARRKKITELARELEILLKSQ